ncbi:MAG: amidohydrolase family protein, partial [Gammaproteobacteria bacterium]
MGSAQADSPKQYQAFVGATLIDGTGRASRPDATVLIENEHISAVGNTSALTIPKNAKIFDVSGKWIVPGLIDAHVHFFQSGGLYTRPDVIDLRAVRPYEKEIAGIREQLPATLARYLASGVTSVVDMGGPNWTFEVRELA